MDKTILVVSGDTGQAFYEHGFASHANTPFEEIMKTPVIFYAPNIVHGIDLRPSQHIDIPPSIFYLLGLPTHPSFQGINLFLKSFSSSRSRYLLFQPSFIEAAIVRKNFKLIYTPHLKRQLVYDLENDPLETRNIADQHPYITHSLSERLKMWMELQINYYENKKIHSKEYPPVLLD